jgi:hypothetical protein
LSADAIGKVQLEFDPIFMLTKVLLFNEELLAPDLIGLKAFFNQNYVPLQDLAPMACHDRQ